MAFQQRAHLIKVCLVAILSWGAERWDSWDASLLFRGLLFGFRTGEIIASFSSSSATGTLVPLSCSAYTIGGNGVVRGTAAAASAILLIILGFSGAPSP